METLKVVFGAVLLYAPHFRGLFIRKCLPVQFTIYKLDRKMIGIDLGEDIRRGRFFAIPHGGMHGNLVLVLAVLVPNGLGKTAIGKESPCTYFFLGLIPADPL